MALQPTIISPYKYKLLFLLNNYRVTLIKRSALGWIGRALLE